MLAGLLSPRGGAEGCGRPQNGLFEWLFSGAVATTLSWAELLLNATSPPSRWSELPQRKCDAILAQLVCVAAADLAL